MTVTDPTADAVADGATPLPDAQFLRRVRAAVAGRCPPEVPEDLAADVRAFCSTGGGLTLHALDVAIYLLEEREAGGVLPTLRHRH